MFSRAIFRLKSYVPIPKFFGAVNVSSNCLSRSRHILQKANRSATLSDSQTLVSNTKCFVMGFCSHDTPHSPKETTHEDMSVNEEVRVDSSEHERDDPIDARNFGDQAADIISKNNTQVIDSKTLYLRGLPYYTTEIEVIQFFQTVGVKPKQVILKYDNLGRTNGKAEVILENEEETSKALKKHNSFIGNRYIEISVSPFMMMNADRMMKQRSRDNYVFRTVSDQVSARESSGHWVRLSGLPYSATIEDVYKFFEPLNITPSVVDLKYSNGVATGLCSVKFNTHEEAVRSLANNNCYMGNRYIRINLPNMGANRPFDRRTDNEGAFQHVEEDNEFSSHKM